MLYTHLVHPKMFADEYDYTLTGCVRQDHIFISYYSKYFAISLSQRELSYASMSSQTNETFQKNTAIIFHTIKILLLW